VQAGAEGELQGAASAAAMSLSAVLVALAVPRLLRILM
jgi:putative effector of murein hydrolase